MPVYLLLYICGFFWTTGFKCSWWNWAIHHAGDQWLTKLIWVEWTGLALSKWAENRRWRRSWIPRANFQSSTWCWLWLRCGCCSLGSVEHRVVFQLHGEVHPQRDHLSPLQGPGHPGSEDVRAGPDRRLHVGRHQGPAAQRPALRGQSDPPLHHGGRGSAVRWVQGTQLLGLPGAVGRALCFYLEQLV